MRQLQYLPADLAFLDPVRPGSDKPHLAKSVVIPFGLEQSVSFQGGTARGPEAILAASKEVELFDEEYWTEIISDYEVATLKPSPIAGSLEAALKQVALMVRDVLSAGKFPLVLGGEHSLTAGAIRPYLDRYPDLTVLQFDAHADLRDGYEGEHFSHAAAMRRVLDHPSVSLVGVGLRNISQEEIPFLEANRERITLHWASEAKKWRIEDIVAPLQGKNIYVTFDLDCFDSSLMPATGTPEPGGLDWYQALDILRAAADVGTIVGGDIVELAPRPGLHACDFLAAKLAYKLLSYALADPARLR